MMLKGRSTGEFSINSLIYLSLGQGKHVNEIRFSVLTAARFLLEDSDWRILIYTDDRETFAGLPVEILEVDEATAREWAGAKGYVYRSKIIVLADSLREQQSQRSAIVDGDTYFKHSPEALFRRIVPGTSLMHVREGRPMPPERRGFEHVIGMGQPVDLRGSSWDLLEDETMWNSGVVGLDVSDVRLCDDALDLNDQLLKKGFGDHSHTAEMVALGVVLSRRTRIRECFDVVVHYWPGEMRPVFGVRLGEVFGSSAPQAKKYETLWRARPKESLERRVKFRVKRLMHKVGIEL
jgi:hypothetical protein